jgi:hypothetical protein
MGNCKMSVKEYWIPYNILKGVNKIDPIWEVVVSTYIYSVWQKACPECVHDCRGFEEVPDFANVVSGIARELRLDTVAPGDVTELLDNNSVSCEGETGKWGCIIDS